MRFQLLDADYIQNQKPIIRLFGKTERNEPICCFFEDFIPYFYVEGEEEKVRELLKDSEEVVSIEKEKKIPAIGYTKEPRNVLKIITKKPESVVKTRELLSKKKFVKNIYEADILFKYRFLIDYGLHGMDWVDVECNKIFTKTVKCPAFKIKKIKRIEKDRNSQLKYLSFDIECIPKDFTKSPDPKRDQIILISMSFEPKYKNKKTLVLCKKMIKAGKNVLCFSEEKEMLKKFSEIIDEFDPDIITGYNIEDFDLPYILERFKQNKLAATFGRCTDKPVFSRKVGISYQCNISGRIIVDSYQILKKDPWIKFMHYDLNTVAKELLGEGKIDIKYRDMDKYWNGDEEKIKKFISYAEKDAELALRIVLEKGLINKFVELAKLSGLLLQDTFGGQSIRVETMLMHEFKKRNILMPSKPSNDEVDRRIKEREKEELKGATVLEPVKGLHCKGCIIVLDFASLYPNIIRTFNISPDSLILDKKIEKSIKYITSPTGAKFVDAKIYEGVIPSVLRNMLETRKKIKKMMKKSSGEKKKIFNAMQLALKTMANSFYGYTGFVLARLYVLDIANSITSFGRENLRKTKKMIEEKFQYKVIYADTDSAFVETDITNLDKAKKVGEEISAYVSNNLPGYLELEFEKIFRTFLILTKKRYAGWSFEPTDSGWKDKIEMKGIETIRRDWCKLVTETMNTVLELILKKGDVKSATNYVKDIIEKIKKNEIPLEKLTIVKGITKSLTSYKGTLPHIELAKKLVKRHPENPPKVGDRLGYVIIAGNSMLSKRAEEVEYVKEKKLAIDSNYYISNQLLPPIERILRAVGISKTELLGGGHQVNIKDIMNKTRREVNHNINIESNDIKKLGGWEDFICEKCKKTYNRMPLSGLCTCGGKILISYHGSVSRKCKQ